VYRARDTRLGREVAVKVLPESFAGARTLCAALSWRRAPSGSDHPNILAIYDVGAREGLLILLRNCWMARRCAKKCRCEA